MAHARRYILENLPRITSEDPTISTFIRLWVNWRWRLLVGSLVMMVALILKPSAWITTRRLCPTCRWGYGVPCVELRSYPWPTWFFEKCTFGNKVLPLALPWSLLVRPSSARYIGTTCSDHSPVHVQINWYPITIDNSFICQSRFILLDSMLFLSIMLSTYCWVRFYKLRNAYVWQILLASHENVT